MKSILFLSACCTSFIPAHPQWKAPQQPPQHVTLLRIRESVFAESHEFVITPDSIRVTFKLETEAGPEQTHYAKALSPKQRQELLAPFDNTYLSRIKPVYEGKSLSNHSWVYNVFIIKGGTVAATRIYKYKFKPMFQLCNQLNRLVPVDFRINYTEKYFEE